jgi:hypothetical protein
MGSKFHALGAKAGMALSSILARQLARLNLTTRQQHKAAG